MRVLLVEDVSADAELTIEELRDDGIDCITRWVDTESAFIDALDTFRPDIVLSDLKLPTFDGHRALQLLRERDALIPFVFVSGTMGEDVAVEALRKGATDYILKGHRARLAAAVRRAVHEAQEQRTRKCVEQELLRAQRFESLALLAGGLSHDLRNLLQPLLLVADSLDGYVDDPRLTRLAALVHDCGRRGLDMVSSMLTFARGAQRTERMAVSALFQALDMLLKGSVPRTVHLEFAGDTDGLEIEGNATELQQGLLNLCLNSIQAMPEGGTLTVSAQACELDADFMRSGEAATPGHFVCLSVTDTGMGMSSETLDRLFQPFFTTKDNGTGLGLVSCQRIVEAHRGVIRIESEPGAGTRSCLYFPAAASTEAVDHGVDAPRGHGEHVLVVEEEAVQLSLLTGVLESSGYDARASQSGTAALQSLDVDGLPQLVVMDADMNLLTGVRTLAALLERDYHGAVLLLARRDAPPNLDDFPSIEPLTVLYKPVEVDALLHAVRHTLDAEKPS